MKLIKTIIGKRLINYEYGSFCVGLTKAIGFVFYRNKFGVIVRKEMHYNGRPNKYYL